MIPCFPCAVATLITQRHLKEILQVHVFYIKPLKTARDGVTNFRVKSLKAEMSLSIRKLGRLDQVQKVDLEATEAEREATDKSGN